MLVDPELLRAFAKQVDDAAAVIAGIDVDGAATAAADGIGGSLTQWATHQVGPHLGAAAKDIGLFRVGRGLVWPIRIVSVTD